MIKNVFALTVFLLAIETAVLYLASHPRFKHWFDFVPSIFWIYFLPMLASTFGTIDAKSPLYASVTTLVLPMSLFILLATVDIRAIARLGKPALIMFFAGGLGIGVGVYVAFLIFKPWIGAQFWSGFGALAGSWTGGSANMIAVKEALGAPDAVFLPMVIVDTVVPYLWMGLLVIGAQHQHWYDRVNNADRGILDDISRRMAPQTTANRGIHVPSAVGIIALAATADSWPRP